MTAVAQRPTIFSFLKRETNMDIAGEIYDKIHKQDLIELSLQGGPGALSAIRRWDAEAWNLLNCGTRLAMTDNGMCFYRHPDGRMWWASDGFTTWNLITKKWNGFDRTRAMTTFMGYHMFLTTEGEIYLYNTQDEERKIYLAPGFSTLNLRFISGGVALDHAGNIYDITINNGQLYITRFSNVLWESKIEGFDPTLLRSVHYVLIKLPRWSYAKPAFVGFWKGPTGPVVAFYSPQTNIREIDEEWMMMKDSHIISWRRDPTVNDFELIITEYDSLAKRVLPHKLTSVDKPQFDINISNYFEWLNHSLRDNYMFVDMDGHNYLAGVRRPLDEVTLIAIQTRSDYKGADDKISDNDSSYQLIYNCFSEDYKYDWLDSEFSVREVDPDGPDADNTIEMIKADVAIRWRGRDEQAIFDVNKLEEQAELVAQAFHTDLIDNDARWNFVNEILRTRYRYIQSKYPVAKLRGEVVDVYSTIIGNTPIYYNYVITVDLDTKKTYLYMVEEINGLPRIGWYWNFDE